MSRADREASAKIRSRSWLGQDRRVGAPDVLVALLLRRERCPARRTLRRHDEGALAPVAQVDDRPDDLRDDVARLAQHDRVPDEHTLAFDLELVVQGRLLDRRPGDDDGLHDGVRSDPPGAPDVDPDVEQLGVDLLGRVLEGDGPPRRARRRAQLALERDLVDLDDDAVDLVGAVVPVLPVVGHELLDLGDLVEHLDLVGRRQAPGPHHLVPLALPLEVEAPPGTDPVDEQLEWPARRDLGVLLPQRPGSRVARVGERRLPRRHERGIEVGEPRGREEDLPADLDELWHAVTAEPLGHSPDGAHVVGDVLARATVATGQRPNEPTLLVEQVHGETVDLQLGEEVGTGAHLTLDPLRPRPQLLEGERVVEAQHPLDMVDGLEAGRERRATDVLRRALGRAQRGPLLLELVETADERVVLTVADRRRVLDVVVELCRARLLGEVGPLLVDLVGDRLLDDDPTRSGRRYLVLGDLTLGDLAHPPILPATPDGRAGAAPSPAAYGSLWRVNGGATIWTTRCGWFW